MILEDKPRILKKADNSVWTCQPLQSLAFIGDIQWYKMIQENASFCLSIVPT